MSDMHRHTEGEGVAEPGTSLQVRTPVPTPDRAHPCCFCGELLDSEDVDTWREHAWWQRQGIAPEHGLFIRPEHQAHLPIRYAHNSCIRERER